MSVNNLTINIIQIIVGVNKLTRNKYIYGQRSHRTNIKGLQ